MRRCRHRPRLHDDADLFVGNPGRNEEGADERASARAEVEAQPIVACLIQSDGTMNSRGITGADGHIGERVTR
jgi:hypothetical protein